MKIPKRSEYAPCALIDLGVAQDLGQPLLSLSKLSDKEQIPATFLEQSLSQLRSAGDANGFAAMKVARRPENKGNLIVTVGCSTGEHYLSTALAEEARCEVSA